MISASEVAVYWVLNPSYTALASAAVYPAGGRSKTMYKDMETLTFSAGRNGSDVILDESILNILLVRFP